MPIIHGGTVGNTEFTAVDYDSFSSSYTVGGRSDSTDVVSSPSPIALLYDKNGNILWHKQFSSNYQTIKVIKFIPGRA